MSRGRGDFGYGSLSSTEARDHLSQGNGTSELICRELCDKISSHLFTIGANVTSMEQAFSQLGTSKDSARLRDRLHEIEKTTNALISETSKELRQLSTLSAKPLENARMYRLQSQRLMPEFKDVTQRYNVLQRKVAEKVKSINPLPTTAVKPRVPTGDLLGWNDDANDDELRQREERQQQLMVEEERIEQDVALLQEREHQIRELEGDILDINQIFRDLGMMVQEQGHTIDNIEDCVTAASDNVEQGREQLIRASTYQTRSRKKMCFLMLCLFVIVSVLIVVIVLSVKFGGK